MLVNCPICDTPEFASILTFDQAPIFQLVKADEKINADYFAHLDIVSCQSCGHLYNRAYSDEVGDRMYRGDVLSNVPVHISMSKNLERIADWIGLPQYQDKRVIEIGAGSGHLSRILAQKAQSVIIFEPSKGLKPQMLPEANITLINEPFSASQITQPVDLIVCRQVLEHITNPLKFLEEIRSGLTDNGYLYLEVPRTEYINEQRVLIDFHYPHVQYFYATNLLTLASKAGLVAERQWELMNGHDRGVMLHSGSMCQQVEISTASVPINTLQISANLAQDLQKSLSQGRDFLANLSGNVGLYGASWHGVAFMNAFGGSRDFFCAFDDNPDYINRCLYSYDQTVPIIPPTDENLQKVDNIVITAFLHQKAIGLTLSEKGFSGQIICPVPQFAEI